MNNKLKFWLAFSGIALCFILIVAALYYMAPKYDLSLEEIETRQALANEELSFDNYVIDGKNVYWNDAKTYIIVTPHTLQYTDYAYVNATSKIYNGYADLMVAVNNKYVRPAELEYYEKKQIITTESYACAGPGLEFNYTGSDFYCWLNEKNNTKLSLSFTHKYDWLDTKTNTSYWNVTETKVWHKIDGSINQAKYKYGGMETWYTLNNFPVTKNKEFAIRVLMEIEKSGLGYASVDTKYWFAFKPSDKTLTQAINNEELYALDPFIDTTGIDKGYTYLEDYLVAAYNFNEPIYTNTTYDVYRGIYNSTSMLNFTQGNLTAITGTSVMAAGNDNVQYILKPSMPEIGPNETYTIIGWVYPVSSAGDTVAPRIFHANDSYEAMSLWYQGGDLWWGMSATDYLQSNETASLPDGSWKMITISCDSGDNAYMYVNDTLVGKDTTGVCTALNNNALWIGQSISAGRTWGGNFDNFMFFNKSLNRTEVKAFYDLRLMYNRTTTEADNNLIVTLSAPTNYFNTSINNVLFNCSTYDEDSISVINLTLIIDDDVRYSVENTTANQKNISLQTTLSIPEGLHNWTCNGTSVSNSTKNNPNIFRVDTTTPRIDIERPVNFLGTDLPIQVITVNNDTIMSVLIRATIYEDYVDTCWLFNGTTNTTIANGEDCQEDYHHDFHLKNQTFIYYANDTVNNIGSNKTTFYINNVNLSFPYDNPVVEGTPTTFYANITQDSTFWGQISAELTYNLSNYTNVHTGEPDNFITNWTVYAPSVSQDSQIPFQFWIEYIYINSSGSHAWVVYDAIVHYQNVTNINIDDCSGNNNSLYNFTLKDERLQTDLTAGARIEADINVYDALGNNVLNDSVYSNDTKYLTLCMNKFLEEGSELFLDATIKYSATAYETEYYNIKNYTIDSEVVMQNITLYDLNSTESTVFKLILTGDNMLYIPDALVYVNRRYLSEGVYKTVEIPKTDDYGQTVLHLVNNDVEYSIVVVKNGEILKSIQILPICQVAPCEIPVSVLNSLGETTDSYYEYYAGNIASSLLFNETTKNVTYTFADTLGTAEYFRLVVSKVSFNTTQETLCDESVYAVSGIIVCDLSDFEGDFIAHAYISRSPELTDRILPGLVDSDVIDNLGVDLIFLLMCLIIVIVFAGAVLSKGNPSTVLILLGIAIMVFKLINIFPFSWAVVMSLEALFVWAFTMLRT